jgi:hypothetical protein
VFQVLLRNLVALWQLYSQSVGQLFTELPNWLDCVRAGFQMQITLNPLFLPLCNRTDSSYGRWNEAMNIWKKGVSLKTMLLEGGLDPPTACALLCMDDEDSLQGCPAIEHFSSSIGLHTIVVCPLQCATHARTLYGMLRAGCLIPRYCRPLFAGRSHTHRA